MKSKINENRLTKTIMLSKKILFSFLLMAGIIATAQVKIGDNPTSIGASSLLELESTNKGFLPPRLTNIQRNAIVSPVEGLTIYNTDSKGIEFFDGVLWVRMKDSSSASSSTNSSAVIDYVVNSNVANSGTVTIHEPVVGVTRTVRVYVSRVGDYSLSASFTGDPTSINGVGLRYNAVGTFTSTGEQDIVFNMTGITRNRVIAGAGSNRFESNSFPKIIFSAISSLNHPSSNGNTKIRSYSVTAVSGDIEINKTYSSHLPISVSMDIDVEELCVGNPSGYSFGTVTNSGITPFISGGVSTTGVNSGINLVSISGVTTSAVGSTLTFTSTTTPSYSFSVPVVNNRTSNGTASISTFTSCTQATAGTLTAGVPVSGVNQTVRINVGVVGTYAISATANGVTFSGSGTFATTGLQNIVLTAAGTPTTSGSTTFTLDTTPNCSFTRTVL